MQCKHTNKTNLFICVRQLFDKYRLNDMVGLTLSTRASAIQHKDILLWLEIVFIFLLNFLTQ